MQNYQKLFYYNVFQDIHFIKYENGEKLGLAFFKFYLSFGNNN